MNKTTADISVVIPLYNHERFIINALESICCQTVSAKEIIVVDDGSTDSSFRLVKQFSATNKKIIAWTRPNSGAHSALNAGIHRSTSKYVALLNSDDMYEPTRLATCIEILENNPKADLACTGISFIDGDGNSISNSWYENAYAFYQRQKLLDLSLINGNFLMTTSNICARRSAFERYGYFKSYRYAHDLAFILTILANGGQVLIDSADLLKYRMHSTNTINEGAIKVKIEVAAIVAEYICSLFTNIPARIDGEYLVKLYQILDHHNLSRLIFPFMGMIVGNKGHGTSIDSCLKNSGIESALVKIAE